MRAQVEEGGGVGDPGRLLHVVGHDDDGEVSLELEEQLLDPLGALGVERCGGLVQQDHVGRGRDGPSDAEPLLLTAGERHRACLEPVLHLVPQSRLAQSLLHDRSFTSDRLILPFTRSPAATLS